MTSSQEINLLLDGRTYQLQVVKRVSQAKLSPRLVVVAYQPNELAQAVLRICLQAIQRYSTEPYELWVVDNFSPLQYTHWLLDYPDINVVLNRTEPIPPKANGFWQRWGRSRGQRDWGSYANAIALELAIRLIDPETRFLMTLHMDTLPCREGWLSFLKSKVMHGFGAAGVRLDRGRTPAGVLHVLGYLVDFQLFRKLSLDFFPRLPQYDVGDKVTVALRNAGHDVFACRNTLWEPHLVEMIPPSSPLRTLNVDRAFDDEGNVIFLHLGRGIRKSIGEQEKGVTPVDWVAFAEQHLLA